MKTMQDGYVFIKKSNIMDKEKIVQQISSGTKKPVDDINAEIEKEIEELKKMPNPVPNPEATAIIRIKESYRGQIAGVGGTNVECIILGKGRIGDMDKTKRATAEQKYQEDKEKAVADGYVDKEGNPIEYCAKEDYDDLHEFRKKQIGKRLPLKNLSMNLFCVKKEGEVYRPFIINVRDTITEKTRKDYIYNTQKEFPINEPVIIRVNNTKDKNDGINRANYAVCDIIKTAEKLTFEQWCEVSSCYDKINLCDFEKTSIAKNRVFDYVVIADVIVGDVAGNDTGFSFTIEDDTIEFVDEKGDVIAPIIAYYNEPNVDFTRHAEIRIIGSLYIDKQNRKKFNVVGYTVPDRFKVKKEDVKDVEDF